MQKQDLFSLLEGNAYPGRGIVLGRTQTHAVIAYFIMGRSENSRNRVFIEKDGGIITQAYDPAKLVDPSLIIYAPVRVMEHGVTIVTNGDQTDTIYDYLSAGKSFEAALRTRTFEPDAPNYTPRISGVLRVSEGRARYALSILKACAGDAESAQRFFYEYESPRANEGHLIHTYREDGAPIPSFEGEPVLVSIEGGIDELSRAAWGALNLDHKVSLFVRYISLADGKEETVIINKNGGEAQ